MALTFKTKAAADVTMLDANAKQVLELIGKEWAVRGVITAGEAQACADRLRVAVSAQGDDAGPDPDAEPERARNHVSLRARVWPFIEMLERAHAKNSDILWGV